ncbi:GMP synthase (glutamine-hydrolyzing) [Mycoblastus sanguinarius]|nr:GMP synthase (glutamine-hydrolyzing) [Mycoblastus sanguinarius]
MYSQGIILSGGPYSVYEDNAPHIEQAIFDLGCPILGICYGLQEIAHYFAQNVLAGEKREYGQAKLKIEHHKGKAVHIDRLFNGLGDDLEVWMSHGDKISHLPESFATIATTSNAPFAGIAHDTKPYYGIQFHPEVTHTPRETELLKNFAVDICEARQHWTMDEFIGKEIARIRALVGEKDQVIGGVSGGVDSTVTARLMHEAIGQRFHAILVDNGFLRQDEAKTVYKTLTEHLGIKVTVIDASERFLADLKSVTDPEQKCKIIGRVFWEVFKEAAEKLKIEAASCPRTGDVEWFAQGTLYLDVIESISFKGPSQTIKTHHNVGGLPAEMDLKLIEPLRELFKDEVRELGTKLGIDDELVWRHPFPAGPGLAIRISGEVTEPELRMVRQADKIFTDELVAAGLYRTTSQAFVALSKDRAVSVMGDKRVWGQIARLRAVQSSDFMTAKRSRFDDDWLDMVVARITNEVEGVTRVEMDLTSKPPGTIEME